MITNIPFEVARDIAYFELIKDLTSFKEIDPTSSPETKMKVMNRLKEYEDRSKQICFDGLEQTELSEILEDFKTNPLSLQSCSTPEKQTYMISEMELLLSGKYDPDQFIIRLIRAYGYTEQEAEKMLATLFNEILGIGKFVSVFDKVDEHCKALTTK